MGLTNDELLAVLSKISEELDRVIETNNREVLRAHLEIIREQATAALNDEICFYE